MWENGAIIDFFQGGHDTRVICTFLKLYLRSLPEGVVPKESISKFSTLGFVILVLPLIFKLAIMPTKQNNVKRSSNTAKSLIRR